MISEPETEARPPSETEPEGERVRPAEEERAPARRASSALLWLMGLLLIALPTISLPDEGPLVGLKALLLEAVGILVAVLVFSNDEWTWQRAKAALLTPVNLAILAFIGWVGISAVRPDVAPILKKMSHAEAFRHFGGALVYFGVVYGLSVRRHLPTLCALVLVAGVLGSMGAMLTYSSGESRTIEGAFPNADILAGFLVLILFFSIMVAVAEHELWRRAVAMITVALLIAAILASGNRAAWFGIGAGVLWLAFLRLRYQRELLGVSLNKHQIIMPALILVIAAGLAFWIQRTQRGTNRLTTLGNIREDWSFQWRVGMWSKGLRLMRDYPWTGSGVGTYRIQQALYYHPAARARPQKEILRQAHDQDNCQNTYLQNGAELGVPGLLLYLSIFFTFFGTGMRALNRLRPGYRQSILIGCLAAIGGGMVMAVGNPSWEFPEVSLFVWLLLGTGMAIAGVGERGRQPTKGKRSGEKGGRLPA